MITEVKLENYGPIRNLHWKNLGRINLVLGGNGSGKTFLLKAVYGSMRSVEEYKRGNEPKRLEEIIYDKLYWTFQTDKIGDLVGREGGNSLHCLVKLGHQEIAYTFGRDTSKMVTVKGNTVKPRDANSIFLPAKEVLSLHKVILKSRDQDKLFGFDDTYLDLARALLNAPQKGKNFEEFAISRKTLEETIGGKVKYDNDSGRWYYNRQIGKKSFRYAIGITAEGIKKIAILDTLLSNRYLTPESIVFIDEPESALHPEAVCKFLDIVEKLSETGMQFFIASHSYFVIKKLSLIALTKQMSIPLVSFDKDSCGMSSDLKNGMPENDIINESIQLYREEVGLALP